MSITPTHRDVLAKALGVLLRRGTPGEVAFLRCFSSAEVDALVADGLSVKGWRVLAVLDVDGPHAITADKAVELREDKGEPTLLVIDPRRAGAGLDGIYSAATELGEAAVFKAAIKVVGDTNPALRRNSNALKKIVSRAGRIGRAGAVTPFQDFDFRIAVAADGHPGRAIARLGFWPLAGERWPEERDLDEAAAVAERLLLATDAAPVSDRVAALLIPDPDAADRLTSLLHANASVAPLDVLAAVAALPDLALDALRPGCFDSALRGIEIVPWRKGKTLQKWSGLIFRPGDEDPRPHLVIDRSGRNAQGALEVRWTTSPEGLPKGAAEYVVEVVSGSSVLADTTVLHRAGKTQSTTFGPEQFAELEDNALFEASVRVRPLALPPAMTQETEEFVLRFGESERPETAGSGRAFRSFAEGFIELATAKEFETVTAAMAAANIAAATEAGADKPGPIAQDGRGFVTFTPARGRSVRVVRPQLVAEVEASFVAHDGALGRWRRMVRFDGEAMGGLEFIPLAAPAGVTQRLDDAARKLARELGVYGTIGRITAGWKAADAYIAAFLAVADAAPPELALLGTVEFLAPDGHCVGLVATPLHPARLQWHMAFDQAMAYARFEDGVPVAKLRKLAAGLDGANIPFILPAAETPGKAFHYADALGLFAAAFVHEDELEPKAALSMMRAALGAEGGDDPLADGRAEVLGGEIAEYMTVHGAGTPRGPDEIAIQGWRIGDGETVARAIDLALRSLRPDTEDDDGRVDIAFHLDVVPSPAAQSIAGRYIAAVGQRRRTGSGGLPPHDRWMTEAITRPGNISVPRLRWAKRSEDAVPPSSHIAVVFDVFASGTGLRERSALGNPPPLQALGLMRVLERSGPDTGRLEWLTWLAPPGDGVRAPDNRTAIDRLGKVEVALARLVSLHLGGGADDWPVIVKRLDTADNDRIEALHRANDWVITADRNACIEYFDDPRQRLDTYRRYLIDAVHDRPDLGAVQLVTTTTRIDEVRHILADALAGMRLSASERNCDYLLTHVKALSGRLALRLAGPNAATSEIVALALVRAHSIENRGDDRWLELETGFLVPVDELPHLARDVERGDVDGVGSDERADFVHVSRGPRAGLRFGFVEVKHRAQMRTARDRGLAAKIASQTAALRDRWMGYFFPTAGSELERQLRRAELYRLLVFHLERARRHGMSPTAADGLLAELRVMLKRGERLEEIATSELGYVFCPDYRLLEPGELSAPDPDRVRIVLFGPTALPDMRDAFAAVDAGPAATDELAVPLPEPTAASIENGIDEVLVEARSADPEPAEVATAGADTSTRLVLGRVANGSDQATWQATIHSNPHLMIVGQPGMGKTTVLINMCRQLQAAGIAPIVFSYHDDIDAALERELGRVAYVDYNGLGFDPLRVDAEQPTAYVDVAGTLRDIFGSIFRDLGDLQLEELRQAIRRSFEDAGWTIAGDRAAPPRFGAFLDILRATPKPNAGLLARLAELEDYGFFGAAAADAGSLLDSTVPTIVRIHRTTNALLQDAFASFVLYSLYKDMFRRGVQSRLTHAIVVDEAHRAARLTLIPRFAKESRKFGLMLILASQEAKDFDDSLYAAVAGLLSLRVAEPDAKRLARAMASGAAQERLLTDRLKSLDKYTAMLHSEEHSRPLRIRLAAN